LINKVPGVVVEGFTVGIALVIGLQQIPFALGVAKGEGERTLQVAYNTIKSALAVGLHWQTILVVVITLIIKFNFVRVIQMLKIQAYIPASFGALVMTTLIVKGFGLDVAFIGEIPRNVANWSAPTFSGIDLTQLIIPALSIAVLAAIESLLSARVADDLSDTKPGQEFSPNQELFGQGLATTVASVFGGMPATGAIARTNVNVRAGAKSRFSAIVHAITLLLIVLFLAPIFSQIPSAAIAGVLIGTSFRIFNKASMQEIFKSGQKNIWIYLITAAVTVGVDLIWGIFVGIALYLLLRAIPKK
jgi:SulP family sulfate permease